MQTYSTAAGETMFVLVRRNIEMLRGITSYRAADPALDQAITRYTILQMQTQDMAEALQNGWTRYGTILDKAEADGLLANNAFDPETQSWQLGNPVLGVPLQQNVAAAQTPATSPLAMTTAEPAPVAVAEPEATPEPEPEPEAVAEATPTPDPPDLASTVTPLEVPDSVPVPTTTLAEVPNIEDQPPAAVAATEEPAAPVPEERLAPDGPLAVAETMPATTQIGDWTVATTPDGASIATAINLVADTRAIITSLSMACAPDQSVAYAINGAEHYDAFRVYADRSQNVTVSASSNVVLGPDAASMAETLASAVAWSEQVPDSGRSLTIRTADANGVLALFPPNGYLDARAAIEEACASGPATAEAGPEMITALPQEEPAEEEPMGEEETAEPEAAPAGAEEPVVAAPVAPVPRPPLDRSQLPAPPPPNQPLSLL
jgi:hypothetical protein